MKPKTIKPYGMPNAPVARKSAPLPTTELRKAEQRSERFTKNLRVNRVDGQLVTEEIMVSDAAIAARVEQIEQTPANSLSWLQLNELSKVSSELAQEKWDEVKQSALMELQSGHRAAKATEGNFSTPMERARFLALVYELKRQYEPRSGAEELLVQNIAQSQTMYEKWLQIFVHLTSAHCNPKTESDDEWSPPRISESEAIENAAQNVERFHRLFVRSIRALKDLRRQPTIVANQVNMGEQQVVMQANQ